MRKIQKNIVSLSSLGRGRWITSVHFSDLCSSFLLVKVLILKYYCGFLKGLRPRKYISVHFCCCWVMKHPDRRGRVCSSELNLQKPSSVCVSSLRVSEFCRCSSVVVNQHWGLCLLLFISWGSSGHFLWDGNTRRDFHWFLWFVSSFHDFASLSLCFPAGLISSQHERW